MNQFNSKIGDIEQVLKNVHESCLYDEGLTKRVMNALNQDSLSHSDKIECDSSSVAALENLENAWEYAVDNFKGEFTHELIMSVASQIDIDTHGYRRMSARIKGYDEKIRSGTNPLKIEREMGKLIDRMNNNSDRHTLIRASEMSLYGLIIHPFRDGNGRTFRLLQNLILYHDKIPPVVIRKSEKMPYKILIASAHDGFNKRCGQENMFSMYPSIGERNYFGFLLDKAQESVEKLSKRYANFRRYELECYFRGNGKQLHGIRDMLRRNCTAGGWVFKSTSDIQKKKIEVITDAPKGIIEASIYNHTKNKPWFKGYDIEMKSNRKK
jgi:hypothetical protein